MMLRIVLLAVVLPARPPMGIEMEASKKVIPKINISRLVYSWSVVRLKNYDKDS